MVSGTKNLTFKVKRICTDSLIQTWDGGWSGVEWLLPLVANKGRWFP